MSSRTLYYWDANIFIAWLTNEPRPADEIAGIEFQVREIDAHTAHLVTSVLTPTEVLAVGVTADKRDQLKRLFQREHCHLVDVTREVAEIAHDIRVTHLNQGRKIKTPDAIQLATAISSGCPVFYTFDKGLPRTINANGKSLVVEKPHPTQYPLGL
ncbi:MAG: type II toxin-antitoxin system VapC family toxin [Anaerolineae bacterium]|nr:type II toxin-antitoxin system VapC family toxin [Anaerolineae bacterium]